MSSTHSVSMRVAASVIYGLMGLILYFMNKIVLTKYGFPYYSFMGLMQSISISVIFYLLRRLRLISFPPFSMQLVHQLLPLPFLYVSNLLTGLGATKFISVPMFVVLRRFTIPITLLLQYKLLNIRCSRRAIIAICVLLAGNLIAMFEDFSFDAIGYILCMINNFGDGFEATLTKKQLLVRSTSSCSSSNGTKTKCSAMLQNGGSKDCADDSEMLLNEGHRKAGEQLQQKDTIEIGKFGILYYSALLSIAPLFMIVFSTTSLEEIASFYGWLDATFVCLFFLCSMMSVLFLYTWITCTDLNTPLLSQVVACLRSILTTYIGIYVGGDYIFNVYNFIGLNLSLVGAAFYAFIKFSDDKRETDLEKTDHRKSPKLIV